MLLNQLYFLFKIKRMTKNHPSIARAAAFISHVQINYSMILQRDFNRELFEWSLQQLMVQHGAPMNGHCFKLL